MSRDTPDPSHPYWVQGFYADEGVDDEKTWKAGDLAVESVHRDEFIAQIEIAMLKKDPLIGRVESGLNPEISYYRGPVQAMRGDLDPKTPCHQFPTRPCIDLFNETSKTYRTRVCLPQKCNRYQS